VSGNPNQIIIVGAGPVGLALAARLEAMAIDCTVIEAEAAPARDLRASTFHPPTLDMLEELGVADALIAQGLPSPTWQIRVHETSERAEFDLSLLKDDTRHPYRLQCEQHRLVGLFVEKLSRARHVDLRFGSRLVDIVETDDRVEATIERDGRRETVRGRLLVGTDGARSTVRERLGFAFDGVTYPETTILAVTPFRFEEHIPDLSNVNYVWNRTGTYSLLRLPGFWRCSLYPDAGETIEQALEPASIERKLQRVVARPEPYEVLEIRAYRVHMRIVGDYRRGRVVLAGDAAHINSPSGGMGMNGGIHDAFALSEEIERVWHGADLDVIDRYTARRRPIAEQEILSQADRNRRRMQERDPARRAELFAELRETVADPARHRAYLLRSSMIEGLRRAGQIA